MKCERFMANLGREVECGSWQRGRSHGAAVLAAAGPRGTLRRDAREEEDAGTTVASLPARTEARVATRRGLLTGFLLPRDRRGVRPRVPTSRESGAGRRRDGEGMGEAPNRFRARPRGGTVMISTAT